MLHILLLILKILGIILLLLLLLLLLILIIPIRYRFQLKKEDGGPFEGQAQATYLIAVISAAAGYIDQSLFYRIRICGFTLLDSSREQEKVPAGQTEEEALSVTSVSEESSETDAGTVSCDQDGTEVGKPEQEDLQADSQAEESGKEKEKKKDKRQDKADRKEKKKKREEPSSGEEKESLPDKIKGWKALYDEMEGGELIALAFDSLKRIVKHIFPQKITGYIRFGFDDPAATGYVTALAATCYPIYKNSFRLEPDFQEQCFEADCQGRGRIRLGFFLILVIRLLLKKCIRKLIKRIIKGA